MIKPSVEIDDKHVKQFSEYVKILHPKNLLNIIFPVPNKEKKRITFFF